MQHQFPLDDILRSAHALRIFDDALSVLEVNEIGDVNDRLLDALPLLREIVHDWNEMLTEEFTPEEKVLFASLIERAAKKASDLIGDEALEE